MESRPAGSSTDPPLIPPASGDRQETGLSLKRPLEAATDRTEAARRARIPAGERVREAVDLLESRRPSKHPSGVLEDGPEPMGVALSTMSQLAHDENLVENECLISSSVFKRKAGTEVNFHRPEGKARADHEAATVKEWQTILNSNAATPVGLQESRELEERWQNRQEGEDVGYEILDSRFIHPNKLEESGPRAKNRWCVAGYQEGGLKELVENRQTEAPTPTGDSNFVTLQVIASRKYRMQIGDITGAFLNTGKITRVLYVRSPKQEPIPGLEPGQLVRLEVSVYGLNTAPLAWYEKMVAVLKECGFKCSRFCPCTWWFPGERKGMAPTGVVCFHVDDVLTGGRGRGYDEAIRRLKGALPFRKWLTGAGAFTGTDLVQREDFSIAMNQPKNALGLKSVKVAKGAKDATGATESQVSQARGVTGGGIWLSSNSRVDLSAMVAMGQQRIGKEMTVGDLRFINQIPRRARQYAELGLVFEAIPPSEWLVTSHGDASLGNCGDRKTQGGHVVGL